MEMLEPWNDFETVSKTHHRIICFFHTINVNRAKELFSDVYSRLIDLSWQDIEVEVS